MRSAYGIVTLLLLVGGLFLVSGTGATHTVRIEANDNPAFNPTTVTVEPGHQFTLEVENVGSIPHTFELEALNISKPLAPGEVFTTTITVQEAGSFEYHCDIPGHVAMKGTLTVGSGTPPATPGFEGVLTIAAIGAAFAVVALTIRRRKA